MPQSIENPANFEIRFIIRFLNGKAVKVTEINRQISEMYVENIMGEGMVGKWIRVFNDDSMNVHYEERGGRPSVITEDWRRKLMGKCERTDVLRFHLYLMSFLKFQECSLCNCNRTLELS
ncbi:hypothetical protein AVEN_102942-1 [Araneus ventricosus]|uniref:Mos1 transposase HTH domain-containing protein n=1 Tax=Araneus ventricosus TaxID=182803 RepID=A0A4Y2VDY3_ARAVE|nr:hypothetical protein AVEN_102942-1 [Araneus ventricosus]